MKTRGLRNNNPLNIRHSKDRWQGARKEQTDKGIRAIRNDGLRLPRGVEGNGIVLEILPRLAQALQRAGHHQPLGTTHGERHGQLHPHRIEPHGPRWQREHDATIPWDELRTVGIAHPCDDHDGVRHTVQGGGCGSHP